MKLDMTDLEIRSRANSSFGGPSAPSSVRRWLNTVNGNFASLRNLARSVGSASRSRELSMDVNWEMLGGDPFSPEVTLMAESLSRGQLPERTLHPYAMAAASESYIDPYSDQNSSSECLHDTAPQPVISQACAHGAPHSRSATAADAVSHHTTALDRLRAAVATCGASIAELPPIRRPHLTHIRANIQGRVHLTAHPRAVLLDRLQSSIRTH
jgi:hypothetical protein